MEYAAFIKLRICKPDIERPYRIPLGTTGCILLLIPPTIMTTVVILLASFATYAYAAVTVVIALVIYKIRRREIDGGDYDIVNNDVEVATEEEATALPPTM